MAFVHGYGQGAHFGFVIDGKGAVGHGAVDLRADDGGGHVASSFVGDVVGFDAEGRVQALMRAVVG